MVKNNDAGSAIDLENDLEAIEGIGPGYARALHTIGVDTVAKLAEYDSPEDLYEDLLDQDDAKIPLSRIKNTTGEVGSWLHQAKELIKVSEKGQPPKKDVEASHSGEWDEHAGFMVFFDSRIEDEGTQIWRTRAYKTENGDQELFSSVEPNPWVNWIFEQARLPADLTTALREVEEADLSVAAEEVQDPVTIKINDVELDEDPRSSIVEKMLVAEVSFEISGPEAVELTEQQLSLQIELWLIELEKNVGQRVATIDSQLVSDALNYTSVATFTMPAPGQYKLHTILLLHPPNEKLVTFTGPIINIVPEPLDLEAVPAVA